MAIFARVVEARSFSGAAHRLNVSKSVVSKHIADLERSLGAQLIVRTTRSITVTEAGRELYGRCTQILRIAEEAEQEASRLQSEPRGVLRVVGPVSFGITRIAPLMPELLATYADLHVDLTLTNRPVNLIEEGFDASIAISRTLPLGMVARRVATVAQRPCAAPSYLTAREAPTSPADLASHNCLLFSNSATERTWTFRSNDGESATVNVSGNFRANNFNALRVVAGAGAGVALLPDYLLDLKGADEPLVALLPGWTAPTLDVNLVYPPGRHVAPKIRAFADFLLAALHDPGVDGQAPSGVDDGCADRAGR